MEHLILPDELPRWVPGKLMLSSHAADWGNVELRSYRYTASDVAVPLMRDYLIVVYRRGLTPMRRRFDGHWKKERVEPGDVSLLTRAARSHWHWTHDIEVLHLYLGQRVFSGICNEIFERDVDEVELRDVLKANDPVVSSIAEAIADELRSGGVGGRLYVDALTNQLGVHLLRHYSAVSFRSEKRSAGLSPLQARQVREYIEVHLCDNPSLEELASVAGMSVCHLVRQFKRRFGMPPHAYIIEKKLARARALLARTSLPLKEIAGRSGFADQAHMTRMFRRFLGVTPKGYCDQSRK